MLYFNIDRKRSKGWFLGPWNSEVPVPVGYANEGVNEEHYHQRMFELYLVAQGQSTIVVNGAEVILRQGDALVVEPGEVHSFTSSSEDYLHFVIHTPFVPGDKVIIG
jgi:mannose-6-phosphate isomerase-like protein (cupin superfamily)